jgi:hypothetical protein
MSDMRMPDPQRREGERQVARSMVSTARKRCCGDKDARPLVSRSGAAITVSYRSERAMSALDEVLTPQEVADLLHLAFEVGHCAWSSLGTRQRRAKRPGPTLVGSEASCRGRCRTSRRSPVRAWDRPSAWNSVRRFFLEAMANQVPMVKKPYGSDMEALAARRRPLLSATSKPSKSSDYVFRHASYDL